MRVNQLGVLGRLFVVSCNSMNIELKSVFLKVKQLPKNVKLRAIFLQACH